MIKDYFVEYAFEDERIIVKELIDEPSGYDPFDNSFLPSDNFVKFTVALKSNCCGQITTYKGNTVRYQNSGGDEILKIVW